MNSVSTSCSPMSRGYESQQSLHILFFPFFAPGHLLPMADLAKLFASRSVKCTIATTPANEPIIRTTIDHANTLQGINPISLVLLPFPSVEAGLRPSVESATAFTSLEDRNKFLIATDLLQEPFDALVRETHPDVIIGDSFFPWSADVAAKHGIPRIVFTGVSLLARCATTVSLEDEIATDNFAVNDACDFVAIPGLPHSIKVPRSHLLHLREKDPDAFRFLQRTKEADEKSYGEVFNSFRELEPQYVEHFQSNLGRRAWLVGPVERSTSSNEQAPQRGNQHSIDANCCLQWLDGKPDASVLYICFGTLCRFSNEQLRELSKSLDSSGQNFVWAITDVKKDEPDWSLEEYERRTKRHGNGFVLRGWAPQIQILNHSAVGGFMTHCGWNSTLESVTAGVPMVTWPLYADQFYNEKLVVQLLKVGVPVGATQFASMLEERQVIVAGAIEDAVRRLMGEGEESDVIRRNARELREKAKAAVADGGSSDVDLNNLIRELVAAKVTRSQFDII